MTGTDALNRAIPALQPDYAAGEPVPLRVAVGSDATARRIDRPPRSYFSFKPQMISSSSSDQTAERSLCIRDPFGNQLRLFDRKPGRIAPNGYNPTFDLWSTAGDG